MTLAGALTRLPFAFPVACPVELLAFAVSVATMDFFICQIRERKNKTGEI